MTQQLGNSKNRGQLKCKINGANGMLGKMDTSLHFPEGG